jgi:hypothetical protein
MKDDRIHVQLLSSRERPDKESVSCLVVLASSVLVAALLLLILLGVL